MSNRIAGFAGSFSSPSKTSALVDLAAMRTAARFGASAVTYDTNGLFN